MVWGSDFKPHLCIIYYLFAAFLSYILHESQYCMSLYCVFLTVIILCCCVAVLLQSLDYIDYDTREVTFNKVVPQAYQVCTTLYYTVTLYMHYTVYDVLHYAVYLCCTVV